MAALIAGLVGIVIRKRFFIDMEGSLMGSFAMVCVCIWNGGFNSIQVICRERDVIKREHRSGMHISSYICAHVLYQALLCAAQTGVTLYITGLIGVKYPAEGGLITPWFWLDFGITMFLITLASDMLSLWVSALARNTTAAMTIMPFILIFQLVFSGGMLNLPPWTEPLTKFTISNPGLKVIASQVDVNNKPFVTISNMLFKMRDTTLSGTMTVSQLLNFAARDDIPAIGKIRQTSIGGKASLGEIHDFLMDSDLFDDLKAETVQDDITVGTLLDFLDNSGVIDRYADRTVEVSTTVGELLDYIAESPELSDFRSETFTFTSTIGEILDTFGEEKIRTFMEEQSAAASYKSDYDYTRENIIERWLHIFAFIIGFAFLAMLTLEFIDKDKR